MARPIFEPKSKKDRFGRSVKKCKFKDNNSARYSAFSYKRDPETNELIAGSQEIYVCEEHREEILSEVGADEVAGYDVLF